MVSIPIKVELHDGCYVATCPYVKGLLVVRKDRRQLFEDVQAAMLALSEECIRRLTEAGNHEGPME